MAEALKGAKELMAFLDQLPAKVEANVSRNGLRAGAAVMNRILKDKMPVKSGRLKKSARISTRSRRGQVSAKIVVGGGGAWYASIVEFGAKAHPIQPEKGKAIFIEDGVFRASAQHPGFSGKGYFRAAVDEGTGPASAAVVDRIRALLRDKHGLDIPAPEDDTNES